MTRSDNHLNPPEPQEDPSVRVIDDILAEYETAHKKLPPGFEETNTRNDFIAYAVAYLGRAAEKVWRNERDQCDPREMLVKAGGLVISAIVAIDILDIMVEDDTPEFMDVIPGPENL